jgi:hypothetical protein
MERYLFGKTYHNLFSTLTDILYFVTVHTIVGNSYIVFLYGLDLEKARETLLIAQKNQAEAQLKLLQQKVDPHFLFNSLNILSSLIEHNPKSAEEFVNRFSELYRYILKNKDTEIVTINEEMEFTENYIYLVKQRFGSAYNFAFNREFHSRKNQGIGRECSQA